MAYKRVNYVVGMSCCVVDLYKFVRGNELLCRRKSHCVVETSYYVVGRYVVIGTRYFDLGTS